MIFVLTVALWTIHSLLSRVRKTNNISLIAFICITQTDTHRQTNTERPLPPPIHTDALIYKASANHGDGSSFGQIGEKMKLKESY